MLSDIEVNLDYPEYDAEEITLAQAGKETTSIIIEIDSLIKSFHYENF